MDNINPFIFVLAFVLHLEELAMGSGRGAWLRFIPLLLSAPSGSANSPPQGFPKTGNGLWYMQPGGVWSKEWLPVGNGYLAGELCFLLQETTTEILVFEAMLPGGTVQETTQLNIESLWAGGPFADPVCRPRTTMMRVILTHGHSRTTEETSNLLNKLQLRELCKASGRQFLIVRLEILTVWNIPQTFTTQN